MVRVNKTLIYRNRENHRLGGTKTLASTRTIALDQHTLSILKQWQLLQSKTIHTNYVLSYNHFLATKGTMSKIITRHAKMANVHRITVHALRHSHASLLINLGVNSLDVKECLGHEDINTTLDTYGHLDPNSNFEVASKLTNIVKNNTSKTNVDDSSTNQFTQPFSEK